MNFRAGRARQVVPPLGQQKRTFFFPDGRLGGNALASRV